MEEKIWRKAGLTDSEYELLTKHMGREPNTVELALYAQMWSEHCGYTHTRPLFKHFLTTGPRIVQGPGENAGIVDIDDDEVITFKLESHNHPSAIAPFQGAATGVGGIIRDILAMGAYPIASLNSLHFGHPGEEGHTRWLISEVIHGIGEYGNCVGVPTVGGEVRFSNAYKGNPLVNAMCVGFMKKSEIKKAIATGVGNSLMIVGNLTGRDGMGGASFASKDLEEENDEDRGAIQVGDPFMEKLLIEACLEVFEEDYVVGVQDMGAAGILSSSVETASKAGNGVEIDVALVPKREEAMRPEEVMISESQERMLLIVKKGMEDKVNKIFHKWDLHAVVIGHVTDDGMYRVLEDGKTVGEVPVWSLMDAPTYILDAVEPPHLKETMAFKNEQVAQPSNLNEVLVRLLGAPDICSKEWVYRQYDHRVQMNTVVKPGSDAAILRIKGRDKGIGITMDSNGRYCYLNPKRGAQSIVAESARNQVVSGAEPIAITDGLNFGNPEKPEVYYQLEQSIIGISEACRALDTPVIGGNASLYNQTPEFGSIYPTPIIGMTGLVKSLDHVMTMEFKNADDFVILIGETKEELGASEYLDVIHNLVSGDVPELDLTLERKAQDYVLDIIRKGLVRSAHDLGDGGMAVALAESCIAGELGANVSLDLDMRADALLFGESQTRFMLSADESSTDKIIELAAAQGLEAAVIGKVTKEQNIIIHNMDEKLIDISVGDCQTAFATGFDKLMKTDS
ncbi:MAG: phosphoribosylformylglycinamidine synthase subunit PurL [Candidatus Marinimicrobia bacterium]|nr:phosphoribosylformylglycinamidine synthase subunit PurL [Candidatus Neomarinimicrobiota bacterium]MBT3574638.1 phosphoribosylformylglycinamidine synthase subunit PurL [Candidatus Neomarinimicrobiota bacterium]MBT3681102.1 phosphoribosylformylglycinamidine synthase subunit PurL [Candidatus Neomarinimicrobiota bacterium]MBT3951657.1 phosphoribosylformylglycinamidine synthase subunit PurL [Candidatus Neomarinimicrobiota bacterium]MBT4252962.1 phosphoribosylformylglycinamidine synthase subunit P